MSLWAKWAVFLQVVFKISTFAYKFQQVFDQNFIFKTQHFIYTEVLLWRHQPIMKTK